jgi:hypothetical protein
MFAIEWLPDRRTWWSTRLVKDSINSQRVSGSHVILSVAKTLWASLTMQETCHPERGTSEGSRFPLQDEISFDLWLRTGFACGSE